MVDVCLRVERRWVTEVTSRRFDPRPLVRAPRGSDVGGGGRAEIEGMLRLPRRGKRIFNEGVEDSAGLVVDGPGVEIAFVPFGGGDGDLRFF